jgi:hypothetical protein
MRPQDSRSQLLRGGQAERRGLSGEVREPDKRFRGGQLGMRNLSGVLTWLWSGYNGTLWSGYNRPSQGKRCDP